MGDTKAKDLWDIDIICLDRQQVRIGLEEEMREGGSKVCSIYSGMGCTFGVVNVLTMTTVQIDS